MSQLRRLFYLGVLLDFAVLGVAAMVLLWLVPSMTGLLLALGLLLPLGALAPVLAAGADALPELQPIAV